VAAVRDGALAATAANEYIESLKNKLHENLLDSLDGIILYFNYKCKD